MSTAPSLSENIKFKIEVVSGPHAGDILETDKASITIGRGAENDLVLSNDPRISRQHVEVRQTQGELFVVNMSQKNFVMLDGAAIQTEKIEKTSVIHLGESEIKISAEKFEQAAPKVSFVNPATSNQAIAVKKNNVVPQNVRMKPVARPQFLATQSHQPAPTSFQNLGAGVTPDASMPKPPMNPKARNYTIIAGIIGIIVLILAFMPEEKKQATAGAMPFRSVEQIEALQTESEKIIEAFKEKNTKLQTIEFKRAQENFTKGYRDYRQGQYARAREAFQVVLNLDPENPLARKYLELANLKFSEMVNFHMAQGLKYREKKNFRLCKASYTNALSMLQSRQSDPRFIESKKIFEECSVALEGRF